MLIIGVDFVLSHRNHSTFSSSLDCFPGDAYLLRLFILHNNISCKGIVISHCTRSNEQVGAFCHKATERFQSQNKMNWLLKLQLEVHL